jgi:hypothetical protein
MAEYEIDEDNTVSKTVNFFKEPKPTKEIQDCPVDEAYLSAYEEAKAEEKIMADNLKIMADAIKASRMGTEKVLTCGKMIAKFTDVEGSDKVDYKKMLEDLVGKIDKETLAKYTTKGKPSVRVEVIRT